MELPHGHILDGSVSSPDALWFIFHLHVSEQLNDKKNLTWRPFSFWFAKFQTSVSFHICCWKATTWLILFLRETCCEMLGNSKKLVAVCALLGGTSDSSSWQGDGRMRPDHAVGQTDFYLRGVPWLEGGCFTTTSLVCGDQGQELMLSVQSMTDIRQLGYWKGRNSLISQGGGGSRNLHGKAQWVTKVNLNSSFPLLPSCPLLFDLKSHTGGDGGRERVVNQTLVLVKAEPRPHRVHVGSGLSSCGKCCLGPQVLVVGHVAYKCCLFVLNQHLYRQPALLPDL